MTPGWYWYRRTSEDEEALEDYLAYLPDGASDDAWIVLWVNHEDRVSVADFSIAVTDLRGEFVGPLPTPATPLSE